MGENLQKEGGARNFSKIAKRVLLFFSVMILLAGDSLADRVTGGFLAVLTGLWMAATAAQQRHEEIRRSLRLADEKLDLMDLKMSHLLADGVFREVEAGAQAPERRARAFESTP